jgi:polysaccharide export outer membrane protein
VGPDGRIGLALASHVMAADRSIPELEAEITAAYAPVLVRPEAQIVLRQAAPIRIYVGGEVRTPGEYEMPGDIDTLQAVLKAGGFTDGARRFEVVVIRRGPDGRPMMKTVDLLRAVNQPGAADATPLRRFDIVYVPRTRVAEVGWPSSSTPPRCRSAPASAMYWPTGSSAAGTTDGAQGPVAGASSELRLAASRKFGQGRN